MSSAKRRKVVDDRTADFKAPNTKIKKSIEQPPPAAVSSSPEPIDSSEVPQKDAEDNDEETALVKTFKELVRLLWSAKAPY
jgi:hypothetical protein